MEILWRCPPDRLVPPSVSLVSRPSGNWLTKSQAWAAWSAS